MNTRPRTRILIALLAAGYGLLPLSAPTLAAPFDNFCGNEIYRLAADETHVGDLYLSGRKLTIDGRQEGDLVAFGYALSIPGEVTGDVAAGCSIVDIPGTVGDSVRLFASSATISGTIDGDLLAFTGVLQIRESAVIHGNVHIFSGQAAVAGTIDGELTFKGGEIDLTAHVGKNVDLEADRIELGSEARIAGDLTYGARKEVEFDAERIVGGEVLVKELADKKEKGASLFSPFNIAVRSWLALSTMLIGSVLIALARPAIPAIVEPIGRDALVGGLIGFGIALIVPAAAMILIGLVIPMPLGVITLVLYLLVMYVAKVPVAIWIGQRLLGMAGRAGASLYGALVVGTLVLYVVFSIPYLRWPLWFLVACLGLGAGILAARKHLQPSG
jgi:cytoskeletal protein CcmA (bactofilin family)